MDGGVSACSCARPCRPTLSRLAEGSNRGRRGKRRLSRRRSRFPPLCQPPFGPNFWRGHPRQQWCGGAGDTILFCRRDPESARRDMVRMVRQLAGRLNEPPKAGIYVSCVARGAALFGDPGVETALIRENLGEFPLIGFFANGEISRDRLYGHTGVLTLFT